VILAIHIVRFVAFKIMICMNYISIFLCDSTFNERYKTNVSGTGLVLVIRRNSKENGRQVRPITIVISSKLCTHTKLLVHN